MLVSVSQGQVCSDICTTGTSGSVQAQDRPQPPQLSPVLQPPHRAHRAVPLRYWQSDNRTPTAVLPHLRATQKGNLARQHSRSPQALRYFGGPATHCHLHRGDWSFHLTNEKKKKTVRVATLREKLQIKLALSPSHFIPTPRQPVPVLTL